ncbi:hypothetical protein GGI43DRAFT_413354 [Trichoderma evansii]
MEGLGIAANIIAVADLSAKLLSLFFQYSREVKNAKNDISRLSNEVKNFKKASASIQQLINGPHELKLQASRKLCDAVDEGLLRLQELEQSLRPRRHQKAMSRAGIRALRWPFQSKDVERAIRDLAHSREAISLALQVDQVAITLNIDEKAALDRLPFAEGAPFNSHAEEHNPTCLPDTRVELLNDISQWIDDPSAKTIFWLKGMAGTGKSTISRTIAQLRRKHGDLGASFFFRRGEADRANLAKFFPTLARQLALNVPAAAGYIKDAIDSDPSIFRNAVREQFDKLILVPLLKIPQTSSNTLPLIFIVDALDECEGDADVKLLISLFSRIEDRRLPRLRIFVTSRPELPIRLGFGAVQGTYQDLVLHEIPAPIIEDDISRFLRYELGKIRDEFNISVSEERKLPSDWPEESELRRLVTMAIPLFIFAATICRFINDRTYGNPNRQLLKFLCNSDQSHSSQLSKTYKPVLNQQLDGVPRDKRGQILEEFRLVVGTIVTLASPLSSSALSRVLGIPSEIVDDRLDMLHSVLSVPSKRCSPIRLLHLSFRDYLVNSENRKMNEF